MAKQSKIQKNLKRIRTVEKYAEKRAQLKSILADSSISWEEKEKAQIALQKLPRDASPTRVRNRCHMTGRPRGVYSKFGLGRIVLREKILNGELPGITKSSW